MAAHTVTYKVSATNSPNVFDIWYVDPSQGTAGVEVYLPGVNVTGTAWSLSIPYTTSGTNYMFISAKDILYPNGNQVTVQIVKDSTSEATSETTGAVPTVPFATTSGTF